MAVPDGPPFPICWIDHDWENRKTERFPGRRHPQDGVDNLTEGSSMAFFTAR